MNTFGRNLRLTTFGESHGKAMGGIIDGFPPRFKVDFGYILKELAARRPGSSPLVTGRQETDEPEFLSGISDDGLTLGTPIGFIIRNIDSRSKDYNNLKDVLRPSHADYTYLKRYGIREHRGGGRASARETVNWVVGGALASQWLLSKGISMKVILSSVGKVGYNDIFDEIAQSGSRFPELKPDPAIEEAMQNEVMNAKKAGDSLGGKVSVIISGFPSGVGNPVFDKLQARLAQAMMSINAAKGFEYGYGFKASESYGSEIFDSFKEGDFETGLTTSSNFSGGIQGGISNGMPIYFTIAFKPTPTLGIDLPTADIFGKSTEFTASGRHDPCVAIRGVAVVKALTALVLADFLV